MANNEFKLENWLPMEPGMGPPLPRFLQIFWPWYKEEEEPPAVGAYSCPYCEDSFDTIPELAEHVATAHPGKPPIGEIEITWT